MREWLRAEKPKSNFYFPPKKITCTRPRFQVHAFSSDQGDKGVCDAVLENHSSSCYNCDQWRVRKMRGGWTGRRRRCSEQGWELSRTVKSCHAWLWSWLTVGPLCFTDLLTACLVVFQEENRSPCRLHQKITSPKLSLSLSPPPPPCHMMALKHGYPSLPCCWPVWLALQPHISTEPSWCQILRSSRRDGTKGGSHKKRFSGGAPQHCGDIFLLSYQEWDEKIRRFHVCTVNTKLEPAAD